MFHIPQAHYVPMDPNVSADTASRLAQLESAFDSAFAIFPYFVVCGLILLTVVLVLTFLPRKSRF